MFLLILCCETVRQRFFWFTFHYVSTYTESALTVPTSLYHIYIPLCFYLYLMLYSLQQPALNLHSTMFLLIQYTLLSQMSRNCIYIPLCFYLYRNRAFIQACSEIYLHSTMFLLIRIFWNRWKLCCWHLHSTMFLLILDALQLTATSFEFTFHYVSTYTVIDVQSQISGRDIYIPLCFYLYAKLSQSRQLWPDLHSTMFLLIRCLNDVINEIDANLHSTMFLLIQKPESATA